MTNCPDCSKPLYPDSIHSCTPKALALADELERYGTLNDPNSCADELRRLHAENEKLRAALRWHIRVYRVADEAWNPDAEVERMMALEMKGEK